ncbi:cobalamin biosynthesis protein CobQ [Bifidobacterium sp. SO1]|uniref:cobalamin biosynthesis protein CobQ n=1 Tax=Bifidobacterium sp. SO1 TaxID=2809029 RepID=UPI001BDBD9DD|nr:cobalamin biosynthesis protein CobQ [Bifidobacterium sp. SO1]MBT1162149.1 cobalamin biosynthesis protein CobQ [Bifidobacterium sp. SO1]
MKTVIIGSSGFLDVLKAKVPARMWTLPTADDFTVQTMFLASNPVPTGNKGIVFTNTPGDWMKVAKAGWIVYWCSVEHSQRTPIGTVGLPDSYVDMSVATFIKTFWNIHVIDKRIVRDMILGIERTLAPLLPVTSNTGGVGKTTSCQRFGDRAAELGLHVLLVDGNIRQSSQRSFFDPLYDKPVRTIADWRPGMSPTRGANPGRMFNIRYDVAFAPPAGVLVDWLHYRRYLEEARKKWDFVILDLDRISADDLDDPDSIAGGLLTPYVLAGDPCLVIVKAGRQTQGDAMNLLSKFPECGFPKERIGIKDTIPVGLESYQQYDYSRYGLFFGAERQTIEAANHIANGDVQWKDPQLDYVRERILDWVMPDMGFNSEAYKPKPKRKGWFK